MIDISNDAYLARMAIVEACCFVQSASVLYRPRIFPDGDQWCCLLGANLMEGISGFGDTPEQACRDFDKAFSSGLTPAATRAKATTPGSDAVREVSRG